MAGAGVATGPAAAEAGATKPNLNNRKLPGKPGSFSFGLADSGGSLYTCSKNEGASSTAKSPAVSDHFAGKDPIVRSIYGHILAEARNFGPVLEEPRKTSIHLVSKSAFAGVTTRKDALILNIKSAPPIKHARFRKSERVSASRITRN